MERPLRHHRPSVGILGFGAFGRLIARHLHPYLPLYAHDPAMTSGAEEACVTHADLPAVARCPIVILAVPVERMGEAIAAIAPHLQPGAVVLDVGSVKLRPAEMMRQGLPADVEVVATHPLFGPQSARGGIRGLKIAICPVRGRTWRRIAAFLRRVLGLRVILTTPEAHDREAAASQGLTHLIAALLLRMEPLPRHMTTASFDLLMRAVDMVRHDAPEVSRAIAQANPYSAEVRARFLDLAASLREGQEKRGDPEEFASPHFVPAWGSSVHRIRDSISSSGI